MSVYQITRAIRQLFHLATEFVEASLAPQRQNT